MSAKSAWKEALREPNAWAWIAVLILVLAIGAGTLVFGGSAPPKGQPVAAHQAGPAK
jgi:hypothetical protein